MIKSMIEKDLTYKITKFFELGKETFLNFPLHELSTISFI